MMFTKTTRRTGMLLHFASAHCCKQFVILHEMLASLFISTTTVVLLNNGFSCFFFCWLQCCCLSCAPFSLLRADCIFVFVVVTRSLPLQLCACLFVVFTHTYVTCIHIYTRGHTLTQKGAHSFATGFSYANCFRKRQPEC